MIELILGIIVLVLTLAIAFVVIMAAGMSDSPSQNSAAPLWTTLVVGAAIEIGLFLLWLAKSRGWN